MFSVTKLYGLRWPLWLLIVLVSATFVWIFSLSMDYVRQSRTEELTLDTHAGRASDSVSLEMTTRLGQLPNPGQPVDPRGAPLAPWWPALMFALAFCGGWFYRHLGLTGQRAAASAHESSDSPSETGQDNPAATPDSAAANGASAMTIKAIAAGHVPDLAKDFPWDDRLLDDASGLTNEERIGRLEKQNASKAEIIKALEKLVTENREKWLHQDETEARLNRHIQELTDDLKVAIDQLQKLQDDSLPGQQMRSRR